MAIALKFEVLVINLSWILIFLGTLNASILYGFHLISNEVWVDG